MTTNVSWISVLKQEAPALSLALEKPGKHVPCPVHGGHDGFRVFEDVDSSGGGICNTCGAFPNGYLLLRWVNGWSKAQTMTVLSKWGINPKWQDAAPVLSKSDSFDTHNVDSTRRTITSSNQWLTRWKEALPLSHELALPARLYLAKRGLALDVLHLLNDCRCHPALAYYDEQTYQADFPAFLALVRDAKGEPITVHRTYLTSEGNKAPVACSKKLMSPSIVGTLTGAAIRLFLIQENTLAVAEGIETALAVHQLFHLPCWATISANGLRFFELPKVQSLIIFADVDRSETGQSAARYLAQRAIRQGLAVDIRYPDHLHLHALATQSSTPLKSIDWLDVLNLESSHVNCKLQ